tara:strand:+ start:23 stop:886 length:864 start_codon:yes stop_codon:yes gene_type:complete
MPELPEVEIIRQSLSKKIRYKKVKQIIVKNRNLRIQIPLNFENFLKNQKIIKIERFSKYIILYLSNRTYCLFHLGMSGTIHLLENLKKKTITNTSFYNSPNLPKKHNHIEIIFENLKLVYNDPRRFGYFEIFENKILLKKKFIKFGPEPFNKKFNENYISIYLKNKNKNIKNFLIDQNFVAGIGNIYASEILHSCKINPNEKASTLNKKDFKKIAKNSRKILLKAIRFGGSSIRDFKNIKGTKGNFQKNFKVYDREGKKCKRYKCEGIILRKIISNRSTFFCNSCQN